MPVPVTAPNSPGVLSGLLLLPKISSEFVSLAESAVAFEVLFSVV